MGITKVANIYKIPKGWENDPAYVYIGRAGHGLDGTFGSPIALNKPCPICGDVHRDNGSTLDCYYIYLTTRLVHDPEFFRAFWQLKGKTLVCFCKPKPCHGDVMTKYLNSEPF